MEKWIKNVKAFLTVLAPVIKDPKTSIRKLADELKVHEKTVRTVFKQDLKLKSFARSTREFLSTKMKEKWFTRCKKTQKFDRKIFLYFGHQIYGFSQALAVNPWFCYMGRFRKQNKCDLVLIRLLLRRNGIKCLKNLSWWHANRLKSVLIQ